MIAVIATYQPAFTSAISTMNVLAFDIETIPDVDAGRRLHGLSDLPDSEVAHAMFRLRREKTGSDFLPTHCQKIVAISAVYRNTFQDKLSIWTLGDIDSSEQEMVQNFFDGIDKHTPTLVTWNGSGFDLLEKLDDIDFEIKGAEMQFAEVHHSLISSDGGHGPFIGVFK